MWRDVMRNRIYRLFPRCRVVPSQLRNDYPGTCEVATQPSQLLSGLVSLIGAVATDDKSVGGSKTEEGVGQGQLFQRPTRSIGDGLFGNWKKHVWWGILARRYQIPDVWLLGLTEKRRLPPLPYPSMTVVGCADEHDDSDSESHRYGDPVCHSSQLFKTPKRKKKWASQNGRLCSGPGTNLSNSITCMIRWDSP